MLVCVNRVLDELELYGRIRNDDGQLFDDLPKVLRGKLFGVGFVHASIQNHGHRIKVSMKFLKK
jgi:hypothetical protein